MPVMEDQLYISDALIIPGHELWFTASRSGGPGGQHVNKTSSRVTLHWNVTGSGVLDDVQERLIVTALRPRIGKDGVLQVVSETHRSQLRNRQQARERLVELVLDALTVEKHRVATRATRGSVVRRLDSKRRRGDVKKGRRDPSGEDG